MELSIINTQGSDSGKKAKLSDDIFNIEPNDHAIYLDVKRYLAAQRQGTHKSKERAEISGSTRKIKKQKGSGTARAGSIKSPIFRGGGRAFGPEPRDYTFKVNKKTKALARMSALSYKAKGNALSVVEDFKMEKAKTSEFVKIFGKLNPEGKKTLMVIAESNPEVYLSSRNIKKAKVLTVDQLNTYELMNSDLLILSSSAIEKLEKTFSNDEKHS